MKWLVIFSVALLPYSTALNAKANTLDNAALKTPEIMLSKTESIFGQEKIEIKIGVSTNEQRKNVIRSASPAKLYDKNVKVIGKSSEQCVIYFKRVSGITRSLGYAGSIQPQGQEPKVGAGALWKRYGHIGYITAIEGETIIVRDANWIKNKITEHRLTKASFRGYIYE